MFYFDDKVSQYGDSNDDDVDAVEGRAVLVIAGFLYLIRWLP